MGLDLDSDDSQTRLEEDEKEGLLIAGISTRSELDEFEQLGIEQAIAWTMHRKPDLNLILTEEFALELHWRMFNDVWRWAGMVRTSNKNLGVDTADIRVEMKKLFDETRYWIEHRIFSNDEIAVRASHRLVVIHPFATGNGRHARLFADILVSHGLGGPHFSWGSACLTGPGEAHSRYLRGLKQADDGDYTLLIAFARE